MDALRRQLLDLDPPRHGVRIYGDRPGAWGAWGGWIDLESPALAGGEEEVIGWIRNAIGCPAGDPWPVGGRWMVEASTGLGAVLLPVTDPDDPDGEAAPLVAAIGETAEVVRGLWSDEVPAFIALWGLARWWWPGMSAHVCPADVLAYFRGDA